jgi:hypothetical protein
MSKASELLKKTDEMSGGYIEAMPPDFDKGVTLIVKAWKKWKNGPATEREDITPAKEDVIEHISNELK